MRSLFSTLKVAFLDFRLTNILLVSSIAVFSNNVLLFGIKTVSIERLYYT